MSFLKNLLISSTKEYKTQKMVIINSTSVAILGHFVKLCIVCYLIGYVLIYNNGYQKRGSVASSVITKVKGVAFAQTDGLPEIYQRIWDTTDLVVPPSENSAFFVTTNVVITPNQTRSTCGENPKIAGARCNDSSDCPKGKVLKLGNGPLTGRCIPTNVSDINSVKVCEISGWCPVEVENSPLYSDVYLPETGNFTVLIKNFVEFPVFGDDYQTQNIVNGMNETDLQNCTFNKDDPVNIYCPIFRLRDIVSYAGHNFTEVRAMGGVFIITIKWKCNLDWNISYCLPRYKFRRAYNPENKKAPGWNFRHALYHEENRRTLIKSYGIRFIVDVTGSGGKFSIIPTLLNIGSTVGLFSLTTNLCDFFILYLSKNRSIYQKAKFECIEDGTANSDQPKEDHSLAMENRARSERKTEENKIASNQKEEDSSLMVTVAV